MKGNEWPLIGFTLLAQTAVGAFMVLAGIHGWLAPRISPQVADALALPVLMGIIALLAGGAVMASAHLARPWRALRAITNLRSSWLSREMLFGTLFGLAASLHAGLLWFDVGSAAARAITALAAILLGLALVYGIARLYMLRTVPVWHQAATPVSFFITALLLGTLVAGTGLCLASELTTTQSVNSAILMDCLRWTALLAAAQAGIQLLVTAISVVNLAARGRAGAKSLHILVHARRRLFIMRLSLLLVAAGLLVWLAMLSTAPPPAGVLPAVAGAAVAVAWAAEVLGRYLFYSSYARVGL